MKKIRVLLADDHTVVREGLRAMLAAAENVEVVGEAADGWEAVRLTKATTPDVVVMDLAMPALNGLRAMREILKQASGVKVLVLSSYREDECVEQLIEAGAAGYLLKHTAATELLNAIRDVHSGRWFFSPAVLKRLRERGHYPVPGTPFVRQNERTSQLTAREVEVLRLIATGFSNREAADELGISIKTIEKHRQQVMNKLNIHETAGITRYALAQRLVEPQAASNRATSPASAEAPAEPTLN